MNNFKSYITPTEAKKLGDTRSINELKSLANAPDMECEVCSEEAWRFGGMGLCFSCTTGESDASDDFELKEGI
jgi:hypothetical protein